MKKMSSLLNKVWSGLKPKYIFTFFIAQNFIRCYCKNN